MKSYYSFDPNTKKYTTQAYDDLIDKQSITVYLSTFGTILANIYYKNEYTQHVMGGRANNFFLALQAIGKITDNSSLAKDISALLAVIKASNSFANFSLSDSGKSAPRESTQQQNIEELISCMERICDKSGSFYEWDEKELKKIEEQLLDSGLSKKERNDLIDRQQITKAYIQLRPLFAEIKNTHDAIINELEQRLKSQQPNDPDRIIKIDTAFNIYHSFVEIIRAWEPSDPKGKEIKAQLAKNIVDDAIFFKPEFDSDQKKFKSMFDELVKAYLPLANNKSNADFQKILKDFCKDKFGVELPGKPMLRSLTINNIEKANKSDVYYALMGEPLPEIAQALTNR
jgi:hypothetical protein